MADYTDTDLNPYKSPVPKEGSWSLDNAVSGFNQRMRQSTMPTMGYTGAGGGAFNPPVELERSAIPPPVSSATVTPETALPANMAGFKGTITDPILNAYKTRIGYTESAGGVPGAAAVPGATGFPGPDFSRRQEEFLGEQQRDIATARTAETEHAANVRRWLAQPVLYKAELAALQAGRVVPPSSASMMQSYGESLKGAQAGAVAATKLPYELAKETAEARKYGAEATKETMAARALPGGPEFATSVAGKVAEAKAGHPEKDYMGQVLMSLAHIENSHKDMYGNIDNAALQNDPAYSIGLQKLSELMKHSTGGMGTAVPEGAKPLNKTIGGKPAYQLPDGRIWTED
jgi:hypothetical protein